MYLDELFGLKGKTAVVTGGSCGIGQVIACGFAKASKEEVMPGRQLYIIVLMYRKYEEKDEEKVNHYHDFYARCRFCNCMYFERSG